MFELHTLFFFNIATYADFARFAKSARDQIVSI